MPREYHTSNDPDKAAAEAAAGHPITQAEYLYWLAAAEAAGQTSVAAHLASLAARFTKSLDPETYEVEVYELHISTQRVNAHSAEEALDIITDQGLGVEVGHTYVGTAEGERGVDPLTSKDYPDGIRSVKKVPPQN